jgi:predicted RNA-binding Zn ribbon-like protein
MRLMVTPTHPRKQVPQLSLGLQRAWRLIGGELCLDFVNTAASRKPVSCSAVATRVLEDHLVDYAHLLCWAQAAVVVDAVSARRLHARSMSNRVGARRVWRRALSLRETVYRLGKSKIEGVTSGKRDLDVLNKELSIARQHLMVEGFGAGLIEVWRDQDRHLDGVLWPIAVSAARLLTHETHGRLKRCPGPRCGWLFVDETKNGGRQWCSMADCGNRTKVKRYRERRRDPGLGAI